MSYEPTVWESGDVITSTKLNKLENGVADASGGGGGTGGGVLVCTPNTETNALDKTWKEIHDAPFAVVHISVSPFETAVALVHSLTKNPITGECTMMCASSSVESETVTWYNSVYVATTENDYPVLAE